MKILVVNDAEEAVPEAFLSSWVKDAARELKSRKALPENLADKELSLVFLKEVDAKQLNWNFRQKDYATDVLSFQTEDPESIGELVLCPAVLKKQAREHKLTYEHELGYMVIHGILHLLGFDHENDEAKAREMMSIQDGVFAALSAPPKKAKAAKPAKAKAAKAKPAAKAKAKPASKAKKPAAKKSAKSKSKK